MVTDYDYWKEHAVNFSGIVKVMEENAHKVVRLLAKVLPKMVDEKVCKCEECIKSAMG